MDNSVKHQRLTLPILITAITLFTSHFKRASAWSAAYDAHSILARLSSSPASSQLPVNACPVGSGGSDNTGGSEWVLETHMESLAPGFSLAYPRAAVGIQGVSQWMQVLCLCSRLSNKLFKNKIYLKLLKYQCLSILYKVRYLSYK